jgi:RNA polymerase sigma-70 factor (ECF subfamily)
MIVRNTTSAADMALLDRIARRDQVALAELYDRHCRLLFSLILRILRDRGESEDILQEVFVRVWDRADSYNPSIGTPAAWLVRISRNRAIDRLRARTVRADVSGQELDRSEQTPDMGREADPERYAASTEERRVIGEALAALPPEQRQLIESAFYEGYTQSELAERFDLPLGTVKTRIRTGMQALRRALESFAGGSR